MTAPGPPGAMSAAVTPPHGDLLVLAVHTDWTTPRPGPDQVLVAVTAAAVSNTDIWSRAYPLTEIAAAQARFGTKDFVGKLVLIP